MPPEKVEKLKDKQVRLSIALTFEHLGEQPKVDVPSNPISWDEAERLISGITEEQQKFDKQRSAVDDIRSALGNYKNRKGAYPDTLTALLEKPEKQKVTNTNASLQIESIGNSIEPLGLGLGKIHKTILAHTTSAARYPMMSSLVSHSCTQQKIPGTP